MSLKINKTVGDISKVAFSLLLGGLILFWMYHDFKFNDIADVLRHDMNWTWMLLSFPFGILAQMFRGWRWRMSLEPVGEHPRHSTSINAVFLSYALSLVIGAVGFAMVPFVTDKYLLVLPFLLIGCAWAAMLAMPFAFVTNALEGYGHKGAYLGLFNGTICIPQIIAAALGGIILSMVGSHQYNMMIVAAVSLVIGAACVGLIKKK